MPCTVVTGIGRMRHCSSGSIETRNPGTGGGVYHGRCRCQRGCLRRAWWRSRRGHPREQLAGPRPAARGVGDAEQSYRTERIRAQPTPSSAAHKRPAPSRSRACRTASRTAPAAAVLGRRRSPAALAPRRPGHRARSCRGGPGPRESDDTVLTGVQADQAALYGVLTEVDALGLELTEIRRVWPSGEQDCRDALR